MTGSKKIKNSEIRVTQDYIWDLDVDAFVFYAQPDLQLGTGVGNAIAVKGGPTVQEELKKAGQKNVCDVVVTAAGNLKAKYIVHAVGPSFQEEDIEKKLRTTILNALKEAEAKGIKKLAVPPMGAGFYGVPLPVSVQITCDVIKEHLSNGSKLEEVVLCGVDGRETRPLNAQVEKI